MSGRQVRSMIYNTGNNKVRNPGKRLGIRIVRVDEEDEWFCQIRTKHMIFLREEGAKAGGDCERRYKESREYAD